MFARVSTFQGTSEQLDESTRQAIQQIVPAARRLAGFQGVLSLIDRATGKSITMTLWQDEEAMRASEDAANRLRAQGAEASGESVVSVERYEVAFSELSPPAA
jgi:heme-degrading monooxygenase HmoA